MWFRSFLRKVLFLSVSSALFYLISASNEEDEKNKEAQVAKNLEGRQGGLSPNNIVYFPQNPSLSSLVARAKRVLKRRIKSETFQTIQGVGEASEGSGDSGPTHRNQDEWSYGRRVTLDDKAMKLMGLFALLTIFQGVLEAVSTGRKRKKRHAFFKNQRTSGVLAESELNVEVLKDLRLRFGRSGREPKEAIQLECIYKRVCELNKIFSDSRVGLALKHSLRRLLNGPIQLDKLRMAAQVGQMGKSCSNHLPKCPS